MRFPSFSLSQFLKGIAVGIIVLIAALIVRFVIQTVPSWLFSSPSPSTQQTSSLSSRRRRSGTGSLEGQWSGTGSGQGMNLERMANRLGMTEAELQKELRSGKTVQEVAKEKGIDLRGPRGPGGATGATIPLPSGSGASASIRF